MQVELPARNTLNIFFDKAKARLQASEAQVKNDIEDLDPGRTGYAHGPLERNTIRSTKEGVHLCTTGHVPGEQVDTSIVHGNDTEVTTWALRLIRKW